jgi:hypothetical protein
MQAKTIKSKKNNIFENGRQPQYFFKGRRPQDVLKKIMQSKIIKCQNNNIFLNGRRPKLFFENGRRTQLF